MRRILLTLTFNGKKYCGWQVQKNGISVCETVQNSLEKLFGSRPPLTGCGRTDSGVHAIRYYASFPIESSLSCHTITKAMGALLPADISVRSAAEVCGDFHPRYSALQKEYIYRIYTEKTRNPFYEGLSLFYPHELDISLLNKAAEYFVGKHDFSAFCTAGASVKDTVRNIYSLSIKPDVSDCSIVIISVKGDGFLYNMVRIIVGTLLYIAQGKISAEEISKIILSGDRKKAGPTALAHGLYLNEVWYPDSIFL